ncbi:hypothetical protein NDU88_004925 [Pleurodeles waltl]|uniref:Uncharacterized protein n=1 Tax=Pleurodeles waltl TaxID=8319 RepID=A0AAV7MUU3_PLEWA|nr:hypothetical protein NDU88_004925 [Pleurodeles waltl]
MEQVAVRIQLPCVPRPELVPQTRPRTKKAPRLRETTELRQLRVSAISGNGSRYEQLRERDETVLHLQAKARCFPFFFRNVKADLQKIRQVCWGRGCMSGDEGRVKK